jgi:Coenzyme PQQ synthesis protein D (PqqD)
VNLLELRPVRTADWQTAGERVVVVRPRPARGGLRAPLEWMTFLLAPGRLRLDALGSFVWNSLDGQRSVAEVAREVRERFGESAEPVEVRLGEFIRGLRREELVAFPGWDVERS